MNSDYDDHESEVQTELQNLISEVRSDLQRALHDMPTNNTAYETVAMAADKMDAIADLARSFS
ncbi:hypothetical protein [Kozakia baliensis]|uniref:Uncharacterized protein n=1 Tax=Kozakia baliensis TaxID=153496 RepID=A0A1D8UQI5_9PROT|nr:hypothetical protein [Kozakia baliensis]AOX15797.1 hypothetical protein A0U89_00145 [Kozakia baliensis]AOX20892.1 hypothetical protein A0U90_12065 [Kozakia baliensis]GBR24168.1 hypothetical protein AA0488_0322 [Kozakia baliensis NRIC 0488]GEL64592.1 hypothetical protein KBA01_18780 [Kozakia baliensis]